eukprot:GHUV01003166.1.p1 GENE.GHUV01003166.1~~GHUV01003166.1.p1  ORF type:complete len:1079 (+),score=465.60 GHUV01003166.1:1177-4413(+)
MTVFMLRSYCEQKELYKSVTVPTNQNGKPRIVVFDAPGALKSFLRPAKRGLLYDFHQQQQKVRSMVRAFKQQGYELVVFLDCNIPDDKLTTWYRRRAVEASTLRKLNQQLSAEPAKNVPDSLWLPPNGGLQMLGDAFAEAGCKVFYSFDDSDKEAAYWAKENGAYAIITDDTDFLCYEGVERIWAGQIKLPGGRNNQIRVNELLRQRLLGSLGLNQLQLQQLAGLLGNDHIKHIARDKIQQLKETQPSEHVCSVLARQVLELQPALGFPAVPIPPAPSPSNVHAAIDPAVKQLVAAAITAVGGVPAVEQAKQPAAAASASANGEIDRAVKALVAAAVTKAVAGADDDEQHSDDGKDHEETEIHGEEEHADEDGHADGDDEAAEEAEQQSAVAAADSSSAAPAANSTSGLVDRCKRAMAQYGCTNVQTPVMVGSGDRWLLVNKGILMRGVAIEDMSRTPSHVLLQPLRLAVYASLGLNSVTEYLCVPDEKWKEWAAGRVVTVPALPAAPGKSRRDSKRRRGGGSSEVDPAVKNLVAAAIANVVAAAEQDGGAEPVTEAEEQPAQEAAGEEQPTTAAEPADDEIHLAVRKLVSTAVSNVVAKAARAYEPLPKTLPTRPAELVTFICRRLRALDPSGEQFSKRHEKLLQLQVTHRQAILAAARAARLRTNTVRLPDLHAANLFLQAYCALQIAQDGKLPKIANLFHVEAFHALCQHENLAKKAEESPRDADGVRDGSRDMTGPGRQLQQHRGAPMGGRGQGSNQRGMGILSGPAANRQPGMGLIQAGRGMFKPAFGMQQSGRGPAPQLPEGGRGRRGDHAQQGGRAVYQAPYHHQPPQPQQPGYVAPAGSRPARGRGVREGYQPYPAAGVTGVRQQRGEQLTWQQRQQQGSSRAGAQAGHSGQAGHAQEQQHKQQQAGYQGGYQQQAGAGFHQGYDQYGYHQAGGSGYQGYGGYQQHGVGYQQPYGAQGPSYGGQQAYGNQGTGRGMAAYSAGYEGGAPAAAYNGYGGYQQPGYQQQGYQQYQGQYAANRVGGSVPQQQRPRQPPPAAVQANGGDAMTWQQQQMVGRRPGRGGRSGPGGGF